MDWLVVTFSVKCFQQLEEVQKHICKYTAVHLLTCIYACAYVYMHVYMRMGCLDATSSSVNEEKSAAAVFNTFWLSTHCSEASCQRIKVDIPLPFLQF